MSGTTSAGAGDGEAGTSGTAGTDDRFLEFRRRLAEGLAEARGNIEASDEEE